MTLLFTVAVLFLGVQLLVLVLNLVSFPVLEPAGGPLSESGERAPKGRVSVLIPARNEASNLPVTLPRILAQEPADEIIVLDDASTDGTADVLASFAGSDSRLMLLAGRSLPSGWNGKNWACQQLADAASGDMLIFTDADVLWEEGALEALLAFKGANGADYLSVWPRQVTESFVERAVVPLVDLLLLSLLPYPGVRHLPVAALSAGNGQLMLWTREAYARVEGHRAFKGEVLEDVRMGQRAKRHGLSVALALGGELLCTRMYRSAGEVLDGFGKNILAAHGGNRLVLFASLALNTFAYTLPWLLAMVHPMWLAPAVLGLGQRALVCLKTRRSPFEFILQPLAPYFMWRIGLRALGRSGGYRWKGRTYP